MATSPEEALAWVNERWKEPLYCEACGHDDWGVAELLALPVSHFNKPVLAAHFPAIPVICSYCGNTKFISELVVRKELDARIAAEQAS